MTDSVFEGIYRNNALQPLVVLSSFKAGIGHLYLLAVESDLAPKQKLSALLYQRYYKRRIKPSEFDLLALRI